MSANNMIMISGKGPYRAFDVDVENWECPETEVFEAKTEKEAIEKAQDYMENNIVEYGFTFTDL